MSVFISETTKESCFLHSLKKITLNILKAEENKKLWTAVIVTGRGHYISPLTSPPIPKRLNKRIKENLLQTCFFFFSTERAEEPLHTAC
jgi:hypothetical protein